jgi:hypothetical protein
MCVTMPSADAEAAVAASISAWSSPLEEAVLGTSDPREIVNLLDDFCIASLGRRLETVLFYRRGVGAVFGLRMDDLRTAVVKVHRAELIPGGLEGVRQVQQRLAQLGLPAPRPLGRPMRLGRGLAAAEELLDRGGAADAHNPAVRRELAVGLRRFIEAATPMLPTVRLPKAHPFDLAPDQLWGRPHDLRFDLTLPGGEWIDDLARAARSSLQELPAQVVIGHVDWRVENLRFEDGIVAIFDWDSVATCPEAALVGSNAVSFTADWSEVGGDPYPSPDESSAFVADYQSGRGRAFTPAEREIVHAASVYRLAYNSRCEYSDVTLGVFPDLPPEHGWRALLSAWTEPRS